jgi:lipopolysaccharide export system permease protein
MRGRLPLLLYSYVVTELLAPFFASFLIIYGVFFLIRLIPLLEIVLDLGINFPDFIRLFSYIFPHILLYVIPMASMTGVIIGFTRLTNEREILALKSCGVSLRQMLPPVFIMAAVIASLTGFFSVRLIPAGEIAMQQLMYQLAKEKIDQGIKEKQFTEALGEVVVYVDTIDEEERWHGVYVSDMRGRQQPIIIMAQRGQMQADIKNMSVTIVLEQGSLHSTEGYDGQTILFHRYQLQIPLRPPTRIGGDDITQRSKGSMSQEDLLRAARHPEVHPQDAITFMTEYHHRLTLPVGCLILSLLGIPLGLQAGPGRRAVGVPLGLAFFVFYYIVSTIAKVLVEDGQLAVGPGMWLPNLFFMLVLVMIFRRVERERPLVPERLSMLAENLQERLVLRPWKALMQWGRGREVDASKESSAGLLVHAHPEKMLFHLPGCIHYTEHPSPLEFRTVHMARKAGLQPCPLCQGEMEKYQ